MYRAPKVHGKTAYDRDQERDALRLAVDELFQEGVEAMRELRELDRELGLDYDPSWDDGKEE